VAFILHFERGSTLEKRKAKLDAQYEALGADIEKGLDEIDTTIKSLQTDRAKLIALRGE
jgi:hypothetical protein